MQDLDKIMKLQIAEAIENIKTCKNLEKALKRGDNKLETTIMQAGTMEWKDFVENLSLYDPDYDRIMNNKSSHFSNAVRCG